MSALRGFRRPAVWVLLWAAMIAAVTTGSLLPAQDVPRFPLPGGDKLQHAIGYAWLASGAVMLFATSRARAVAAVGLWLLGGAIELAQGALTASRAADPWDLLANAAGILAGLPLARTRLATWWLRLDQRWFRAAANPL